MLRFKAEREPEITRISEIILQLTNGKTHGEAMMNLKTSDLLSQVQKSCKCIPAQIGEKLFKIN